VTKRQKYKKSYGAELLRIAETDIESAKLLFATRKARPETVVFHVQQADIKLAIEVGQEVIGWAKQIIHP
jgi:hypothetical protein